MSDLEDALFSDLATSQDQGAEEKSRNLRIARSIRAGLTEKQRAVIKDPHRFKSAICPRRAGKSWTAMSYALITALSSANARVVIVTLTLKSAKNIYWYAFQQFCDQYGIPASFYINDQRMDLMNGSQIMLLGAESRAQLDKLRGGSYDLVVIDECKSYPPMVIRELIFEVVAPALMDRKGSLLLIGTPGNILDGPFFEATFPGAKDKKSGKPLSRTYDSHEDYWRARPYDSTFLWSRHCWTLQHNTHLPDAWEQALQIKEASGWDDDHPIWQREYLGKWVSDESAFVYSYAHLVHTSPETVCWEPDHEKGYTQFGLPHEGPWHFILGLDMGFVDDFAMVIGAYSPFDKTLYHCWDFKEVHQDPDQIAQHVHRAVELIGEDGFSAVVADTGGAGKPIVEMMNRRYGWNIQPADKRDKYGFIEVVNGDYRTGRVRVLRESDLSTELQGLQWDLTKGGLELQARTGRLKEHKSFPNHLADAWLYIQKYSYHFWADSRPVPVPEGGEEWRTQYRQKAFASLLGQRKASDDFWDEIQASNDDPLRGFYVN